MCRIRPRSPFSGVPRRKKPLKRGRKRTKTHRIGIWSVEFSMEVEKIEAGGMEYSCLRVLTTFREADGAIGKLFVCYAKGVGPVQLDYWATSGREDEEEETWTPKSFVAGR